MSISGECQNPKCSTDATETYKGDNGNHIRVCDRHYWNLVTGKQTYSTNVTLDATKPVDSSISVDNYSIDNPWWD